MCWAYTTNSASSSPRYLEPRVCRASSCGSYCQECGTVVENTISFAFPFAGPGNSKGTVRHIVFTAEFSNLAAFHAMPSRRHGTEPCDCLTSMKSAHTPQYGGLHLQSPVSYQNRFRIKTGFVSTRISNQNGEVRIRMCLALRGA